MLAQFNEHVRNGLNLTEQKKWDEAKQAYERAKATAELLKAKPPDYDALDRLIAELEPARKADEARAQAEQQYRQAAEDGRRLAGEGNWAEAKRAFESAREAAETLDEMPADYTDVTDGLDACRRKLEELAAQPTAPPVQGTDVPGPPPADRAKESLTARCKEMMDYFKAPGEIAVEKLQDNYYACIPFSVPWGVAADVCQSLGGHLVTIESAEENQFLWETICRRRTQCWIGCSDAQREGDWVWLNGKHLAYSAWDMGEPNDANREQHFGSFGYKGNPRWDDAQGWNKYSFICEWEAPQAAAPGAGPARPSPYADISVRLGLLEGAEYEQYLQWVKGKQVQFSGWVVGIKTAENNTAIIEVDIYSFARGWPELKAAVPAAVAKNLRPGMRMTFRGTVGAVLQNRVPQLALENVTITAVR